MDSRGPWLFWGSGVPEGQMMFPSSCPDHGSCRACTSHTYVCIFTSTHTHVQTHPCTCAHTVTWPCPVVCLAVHLPCLGPLCPEPGPTCIKCLPGSSGKLRLQLSFPTRTGLGPPHRTGQLQSELKKSGGDSDTHPWPPSPPRHEEALFC
jgi:hypothetical protein